MKQPRRLLSKRSIALSVIGSCISRNRLLSVSRVDGVGSRDSLHIFVYVHEYVSKLNNQNFASLPDERNVRNNSSRSFHSHHASSTLTSNKLCTMFSRSAVSTVRGGMSFPKPTANPSSSPARFSDHATTHSSRLDSPHYRSRSCRPKREKR